MSDDWVCSGMVLRETPGFCGSRLGRIDKVDFGNKFRLPRLAQKVIIRKDAGNNDGRFDFACTIIPRRYRRVHLCNRDAFNVDNPYNAIQLQKRRRMPGFW